MADKELLFRMTMPTPPADKQEMVEHDFLEFAARGGDAVKAEVIKGPAEWTLKASFTDPELFIQFSAAFPGGKDALVKEAVRRENQKRMASRDPDVVLVAVLFDRKQRVADVIFHTNEEDACKRGLEEGAPVIFFIGMKHAGGIDTDLWVDGIVVEPGYGMPSKAIMERMKRVALKAVIEEGIERGKATVAAAGKA